ncbi:P1 family peptidase [Herbiconiux sp.]|uniref:P1 family peptidase n=1 Tax=Herbiconiux sp. TaxID=1871186 RepID=UPI0025BA851E|nr:P1 family peptidase [Herbiconiux sp.]
MTTNDSTEAGEAAVHRLTPVPDFGDRPGNDDAELVPSYGSGSGSVPYDFDGVLVGTAEYEAGPTGATVIAIPAGARMAIDARGGAIGLTSGFEFHAHAICLAGGSIYGLAAGAGVQDELLRRAGNRTSVGALRLVSTAVIYDFAARDNAVYPDAALGRAALLAAKTDRIPVGRVGAGSSASSGKVDWGRCEFTGQGAAFGRYGELKVLVVTVVNPVGVIVDRSGAVVRGNYSSATGERHATADDYEAALSEGSSPVTRNGNTTLTVVVTNVRLTDRELAFFGRQVHGSMHRAIQPFHTTHDGDTLFALTTDEVDLPPHGSSDRGVNAVSSIALATVASELAWDAVLSSVS